MSESQIDSGGAAPQGRAPTSGRFLGASIVLAALIIGVSLVYSTGLRATRPGGLAQVAGERGPSRTADALKNLPDDDVILGDPQAPVTFVNFGDFQCPVCKRMFDDVEGRLREEYVATGKIRFIYRDFPIDSKHPFARAAAEAAECSRDQGKYWVFHDALFARQGEIPRMDFGALADELGLDGAAFRACVAAGKYKDEVEQDYRDGVAAGVTGTPGNFINGKLLPGLFPYETFKAAIEEELAKVAR